MEHGRTNGRYPLGEGRQGDVQTGAAGGCWQPRYYRDARGGWQPRYYRAQEPCLPLGDKKNGRELTHPAILC